MYKPKHLLEYAVLRAMGAAANRLSYPAALRLGQGATTLAFALARRRVHEACRRIETVFPGQYTLRERRQIARQSALNMILIGVEMLRLRRNTPAWLDSVFDAEATLQDLKARADAGQGCVIAVPHMGNWELAAYACHARGIPVFTFGAQQRNPLVNRHLQTLRQGPGIVTIPRDSGSLRDIVRRLKQGQALAILPDVRMRTPGIAVPFLGGNANVGAGMAMFARLANVPILPCLCTRIQLGRHAIRSFDPVTPDPANDKDADIRRMTLAVMALYDREIRRQPGQWFWFNQRWILDPVAT